MVTDSNFYEELSISLPTSPSAARQHSMTESTPFIARSAKDTRGRRIPLDAPLGRQQPSFEMAERPSTLTGGYLCGAVRYTIDIESDSKWPPLVRTLGSSHAAPSNVPHDQLPTFPRDGVSHGHAKNNTINHSDPFANAHNAVNGPDR